MELAVTAALLHDVVDDTSVDPAEVEATFGPHVAGLVATVTQLSQMNQLMRRKHREAGRNPVRSPMPVGHVKQATACLSGLLQ